MGNTVLVVDDSSMVRRQVARALVEAGFDVVEACDGQEALEKVGVGAAVSLIVCDVNMPRMGGLEFLERLRGAPVHGDTPVVMLTTEAHPDLVAQAKRLGARGWIVKPFAAALLVSAVRKLTAGVPA